ncbi:hypothetical protein [Streptomyces sp. NRRL S-350]|uniref:hypothetical protein n=1 Tax=Streptomyces sp. NRRL S-350 TaxID=1463902 RepID=UPI0004C0BCCE|nr:hypothetical protein [Streptomyces sp. NRRL S-350]
MATTIAFNEVITYVTNNSTAADLDRFDDNAEKRRKQLRSDREASITAGQSVRLGGLKDFTLNGLRGTVASIDKRARGKAKASIRLDAESTTRYRSEHYLATDDAEYTLPGIPLACVYPI